MRGFHHDPMSTGPSAAPLAEVFIWLAETFSFPLENHRDPAAEAACASWKGLEELGSV